MSETAIAGIMRAGGYSPNHIGNDAAIFNAVMELLRKRGYSVTVYNEEQLANGEVTEDIIVNMCRERRSMDILQQKEDAGALVVNSGYGIYNCTRERMTRLLQANDIPYPDSLIVDTNENAIAALDKAHFERAWIKRGDLHSKHKEDICFVRHSKEAQEVLQEYFLRGIPRAVINRHIPGDLIKFYGVYGTPFFYYFYPFDRHVSGENEAINGRPNQYNFDLDKLKAHCNKAAEMLDVVIYGGDCIVEENGNVTIIDFNDWPSFAPCRNEAAPFIAKRILAMIKARKK